MIGASFSYSVLVVKIGMETHVGSDGRRRNTADSSDITVLKLKII